MLFFLDSCALECLAYINDNVKRVSEYVCANVCTFRVKAFCLFYMKKVYLSLIFIIDTYPNKPFMSQAMSQMYSVLGSN